MKNALVATILQFKSVNIKKNQAIDNEKVNEFNLSNKKLEKFGNKVKVWIVKTMIQMIIVNV